MSQILEAEITEPGSELERRAVATAEPGASPRWGRCWDVIPLRKHLSKTLLGSVQCRPDFDTFYETVTNYHKEDQKATSVFCCKPSDIVSDKGPG